MGDASRAGAKQAQQPCGHCGGTGLEHVRLVSADGDWRVDYQGAAASWLDSGARRQRAGALAPCIWVSCKHHIAFDVNPDNGAIKENFPDLDPTELPNSCSLDVADLGPATLEEVGEIQNFTRERCRQIEVIALAKVEAAQDMFALRDFADEGPVGKRRLPVLVSVPDTDDDEDEDDIQDSDTKLAAEAVAFALRVVR